MKLPNSKRVKSRGVAILMVMSMLALMLIFVIGLFMTSQTARVTSQAEAEVGHTRLLADTTLALALAQLRLGTGQEFPDGTPKLHTTQPGAVRVHGMDGSLQSLVKLYSAREMVTDSLSSLREDLPLRWDAVPGQFVDLNTPVFRPDHDGGTRAHYSIVDPRAMGATGTESVEGFSYDTAHGPAGTQGPETSAPHVPMPVRWLYVLQSGDVGTLDDNGKFSGTITPDRTNPIIGRIAFWVDDETCKINVNTASEGVFWDVPRADTTQERQLAKNQPSRGEYHRHPGHPASVCLSSVLFPHQRYHAPGFPAQKNTDGGKFAELSLDQAEALWKVGRLQVTDHAAGTSLGGRQQPTIKMGRLATPEKPPYGPYATVADIFWDQSSPTDARGKRQVAEVFAKNAAARERLTQAEFFLTTKSAAPELTLFGTPRIALWPVHGSVQLDGSNGGSAAAVTRATPYDIQVAMLSSLNEDKYYVQRLRPSDGAWDLEKAAQGRNKILYDYLREMTSRPVPGFFRETSGYGTFADKYGTGAEGDRDGILLKMLDYVRTANFSDGGLADDTQFPVLCPGNAHEGFGQVTPLHFGGSAAIQRPRGLGRILTVSEVALVFLCRAEVRPDGKIAGEPSAQNRAKLLKPGDREVELGLLLEAFVPSQGWADYHPYVSISLVGGAPGAEPDFAAGWPEMTLNGTVLQPLTTKNYAQSPADPARQWLAWGGAAGVRCLAERLIAFRPVVISGTQQDKLVFSGTAGQTAQQLKLAIYDDPASAAGGKAAQADLAQVIPLGIPDIGISTLATVPLPRLPESGAAFTFEKRVRAAMREGRALFQPGDVVQSLVPAHGDFRLLASQRRAEGKIAGPPVFVSHPQWGQRSHAHSLREPSLAGREGVLGRSPGDADTDNPTSVGYFPDLPLAAGFTPDFAVRLSDSPSVWAVVSGATQRLAASQLVDSMRQDHGRRGPARPDVTGDFDNGTGPAADGPYSNRPDDGNLRALTDKGVPYFPEDSQKAGLSVPPVSADMFSAHRQIPSAIMLGSLPTGSAVHVPWQTLLFRPNEDHFGAKSPPDHLLTDFFWQPVVAPEPVSTGWESEGKINLNHGLVPFSHITRSTALHAAMKAEMLMAIPDASSRSYKNGSHAEDNFRHYIDAAATLKLWDRARTDEGRVFLTPSEICEHFLVPEGYGGALTDAGLMQYWNKHRLTGDNTKERPYAHLLAKLTTRSHVFRVHFVVESLAKARSAPPEQFVAGTDLVTAQLRGSALLRRRLDFTAADLPDHAHAAAEHRQVPSLQQYYRWSVEDWRESH